MDFYVILGVERGATRKDLKRAYTRLARRFHPDLNPGDREAAAFYRQATQAYETLVDPDLRLAYDSHGEVNRGGAPRSVEFHGFDFSTPVSGASATFDELFADVLPSPKRGAATAKGGDLVGDVELTFDEALRGTEHQLSVTRLNPCEPCGGTGLRRARETACTHCQGLGTTRWRRGHMVFSKPCDQCGGGGRQRRQPCSQCGASGVSSRTDVITIQVPAGVSDRARMRIAGQGNAGRRGGERGDLYIVARVAPHRVFSRDGDDLLLTVPLAVHEAALGATIEIPTPDGAARLKVPAGTQAGQSLRLTGQGAPSPRTGERGDLIITVTLALPRVSDARTKELLQELGRLDPGNVRRNLFAE
jgi:molecular chaperone DnaJ